MKQRIQPFSRIKRRRKDLNEPWHMIIWEIWNGDQYYSQRTTKLNGLGINVVSSFGAYSNNAWSHRAYPQLLSTRGVQYLSGDSLEEIIRCQYWENVEKRGVIKHNDVRSGGHLNGTRFIISQDNVSIQLYRLQELVEPQVKEEQYMAPLTFPK